MDEKTTIVTNIIQDKLAIVFQSREIEELINFCKIENNFSYLETLKTDIKYKVIIENLFIDIKKLAHVVVLSEIGYKIENVNEVIFNIWFTIKNKNIYKVTKLYYNVNNKKWIIK